MAVGIRAARGLAGTGAGPAGGGGAKPAAKTAAWGRPGAAGVVAPACYAAQPPGNRSRLGLPPGETRIEAPGRQPEIDLPHGPEPRGREPHRPPGAARTVTAERGAMAASSTASSASSSADERGRHPAASSRCTRRCRRCRRWRCACATTPSPRPTSASANQRSAPRRRGRPVPGAKGDRMSPAPGRGRAAGRCAARFSSVEADATPACARLGRRHHATGRLPARRWPRARWRAARAADARLPRAARAPAGWACRSRLGHLRHRRLAPHRRLEDAEGYHQPLRRHRGGAAGQPPHGEPGQAELRRVRDGLGQRELGLRAVHNPGTRRACRAALRRLGAAVAARLVPAATGTDTGGSIRQPAGFCGITGIKPTYGVCALRHGRRFASSLTRPARWPLAEDCALLLSAMSGFDERDATSAAAPAAGLPRRRCWPAKAPTPGAAAAACASACRRSSSPPAWRARRGRPPSRRAGRAGRWAPPGGREPAAHRAVDPGLLHHRAGREASSNLSRFDGVVRPPRRRSTPTWLDMYKKTARRASGPR